MPIVDPVVETWLEELALRRTDDVERAMAAQGAARGFPIVGPVVGAFLGQWAKAVGARRVFEMGSGFGYSTLFFARAVGPEGQVVHTDGDPTLSEEAGQWMDQAGVGDRVDRRVGDALDLLENDGGLWDVVFCDVDKHDYPRAWALAAEHVRPGGVVLFDNALWQGKAADPATDDVWGQAVREAVEAAFDDPRFACTLMPIRDGVLVARRLPAAS